METICKHCSKKTNVVVQTVHVQTIPSLMDDWAYAQKAKKANLLLAVEDCYQNGMPTSLAAKKYGVTESSILQELRVIDGIEIIDDSHYNLESLTA